VVEQKRAQEDRIVEKERAVADEVLQAERAEQTATLTVERDETDKDLLRERAHADDAVATRDDFLGIVSHDLRNMLHSVVGFAGLITQGVKENRLDQVSVYAQRIERSGARMNRLIGDLVDVASIEAGKLAVTREVGDPALVVTEAVDTFQAQAAANGVSLAAEVVAASALAAFDPARILQVLTNLLGNALKFTPRGGSVVVRVERIGDELRFSVSDTGPGIPADKLEAVFERFRQVATNDRRGVGLGLYISKCIVQGHGGRIWAENRSGKGATFSFTLPIDAAS
jgi:signal transduction histidine kinase